MVDWEAIQKKKAKARLRKKKRKAKRNELSAQGFVYPISFGMYKKKVLEICKSFIKLRDKYRHGPMCRICGKREGNVAYHLIPQQRGDATKFLKENMVLACRGCNYGEYKNRSLYRDKHILIFGKEHIENLERIASIGKKFSRDELKSIEEDMLARMEMLPNYEEEW